MRIEKRIENVIFNPYQSLISINFIVILIYINFIDPISEWISKSTSFIIHHSVDIKNKPLPSQISPQYFIHHPISPPFLIIFSKKQQNNHLQARKQKTKKKPKKTKTKQYLTQLQFKTKKQCKVLSNYHSTPILQHRHVSRLHSPAHYPLP